MAEAMTALLGNVTSIFSNVMSMLSSIGSTVTSTPLILLFVLIPVIFLGVNMFRKLLSL